MCAEFATVSYYAMLRQVSTPANIGRVSGFGWSMGYFGGIVLLLVCYVGFISGEDGSATKGLFEVSTDGGLNIRVIAIFAAVWFGLFAIPVLFKVPEVPAFPGASGSGFFASYRLLWRDLADLYRVDRNAVYFLGASALFRDGLAAIFSFGAILAHSVYGISTADVLIFGVAANVVSAIGALVAGRFDDRVGPKAVIVTSLTGMLVAGFILLFLHGPTAFWIFGLVLCLFVGPAQSSSRTYLARMSPPGPRGPDVRALRHHRPGRVVPGARCSSASSPQSSTPIGPASSASCSYCWPACWRSYRCGRRWTPSPAGRSVDGPRPYLRENLSRGPRQRYSPVAPSMDSRSRSAWPLCRAYSSIMWVRIQRRLKR